MSETVPIRKDLDEWAYIALGSNLGDSQDLIENAIQRLSELSERPILVSSLWRTTPVDCPPDSPPFINGVVGLKPHPGETPETLLAKLQKLEQEFGRKPKTVLNEPRPLDLDLLTFGNQIRATPKLTLPHPRAHQRRFVLQPLSEIAPGLVLPGHLKTVAELLARLPPDESVKKVEPPSH